MAYLRIFMGNTLLEQRELSSDRVSIGRAEDNDIVLRSGGVSKHHAVIERDGQQFLLKDANSANGVFVGGQRIDRHVLQFWDEIQIVDYVLKFMAVARLKGEEAGQESAAARNLTQEATMELDISGLGDLIRLKKARQKIPSIQVQQSADEAVSYPITELSFTIGRATGNDVQLPGWWTPKIAASIQRRSDGFYLMPGKRGRVSVNGRRTWQQIRLSDGDTLSVRGVAMTFLYRAANSS